MCVLNSLADPYAHPKDYDRAHAPGTAREARDVLRVAARFMSDPENGAWLECACGTGRYGRALLKRGVRSYTGVDLHPAMVGHANRISRNVPKRRFRVIEQDMRDLRGLKPAFSIAFCIDNSIRHLASDAAMIEHLRSVARILKRGKNAGVYIVGMGLLPTGGESPSEAVSIVQRGGVTVRMVANFLPPDPTARGRAARVELCFMHTSVSSPRGEREHLASFALRTWTLAQWRRVVRAGKMREIAVVDAKARDLGEERTGYAYRVLAPATRRS